MNRRELLASTITPDGMRMTLSLHSGDYYIEVDGQALMSTRAPGSEKALAEIAARELAGNGRPRVLIGGLGLGFTLGAALDALPRGASIVVVEFFETIVDWNHKFSFQSATDRLADPRVSVKVADIVDYLRHVKQPFDAILLDVDNGPDAWCIASNEQLYDRPGLSRIQRALKPGGLLAVWSAAQSSAFEKRLAEVGFAASSETARSRGHKGERHTIFLGRGVMRRLRINAMSLLLVMSVTLSIAGDGGAAPGYVSEVLDNGLRVSILSDPDNTVVATRLWYHVGSANEEARSRGFAHLFEHLMFGATANHEKDEYANHHHRHGGDENAYTSFDETVYDSTIAKEHHSEVLELEADRLVNLVLDESGLENEKKIVSEELRVRMENDPYSRIGVAALKAVFGEHPYALMPGGTREDVAAATLDQCRRFYESYYRPRNAHLVIVGPVDVEEKLAEVRELFGRLPPEGVTPPDVPSLTDWDFPEEVTLKEDLPPAEIAILGYTLPPADGEEYWAISLMQQLLGGGAVDPFEDSLVTRRRKAVYASTDWMTMRRGGALIFNAAFLPYRTKSKAFRLMEQTRDELAELGWLTEESLASAKRTLIRREMNKVYYAGSRADAIGHARWWLGDERLAFDAAERIEDVTRDEVERVFRTYVIEARPVRVYLRPEKIPLYVRLFGWLYPLVNR